jgi:arylsulfatase A-like enzyme
MGMGNETGAMHGRSFLPVLRGDMDDHRETIVAGYYAAPDRCVRDTRWSYVSRPAGEPDELYDLAEDPHERVNLIDAHPEEAQRLARAYGGYFRRGGAQVEVKGIQGKYEMASGSVA